MYEGMVLHGMRDGAQLSRGRGRPSKKRKRGSVVVTADMVFLRCQCQTRGRDIPRQPNEDVGELLDREAIGWYTCVSGVAMCPVCIALMGGVKHGPAQVIHGENNEPTRTS